MCHPSVQWKALEFLQGRLGSRDILIQIELYGFVDLNSSMQFVELLPYLPYQTTLFWCQLIELTLLI
jgi:hypothetical protein